MHRTLAIAWVSYNSLSGKASAKQVDRVLRQFDVDTLRRLLAERGITVADGGVR
jgi:hypothetical protein